jgi:uncharacterized RDD family membrane protein YckC
MIPLRPRITDLYEDKLLTRRQQNAYGQVEHVQRLLRYKRPVNNASSSVRFFNFLVDLTFIKILVHFLGKVDFIIEWLPFSDLLTIYVYPLYYFIGEFFFQRTVGKLLTGSIVVDEYCEKPDFQTTLLRCFVRLVPFEIFSFAISYNGRGWHDQWSNTYVMKTGELEHVRTLMLSPENLEP